MTFNTRHGNLLLEKRGQTLGDVAHARQKKLSDSRVMVACQLEELMACIICIDLLMLSMPLIDKMSCVTNRLQLIALVQDLPAALLILPSNLAWPEDPV